MPNFRLKKPGVEHKKMKIKFIEDIEKDRRRTKEKEAVRALDEKRQFSNAGSGQNNI